MIIVQVVIQGAGLDTRPWRLNLGPDVTVYDIDQRDMTDFKRARLSAADAQVQVDGKPHCFPPASRRVEGGFLSTSQDAGCQA